MDEHQQQLSELSRGMHDACREGRTTDNIRLLDGGESTDCTDGCGRTSLMFALDKGKVEVGKVLIGRGADLSLTDNHGWNSLYFAVKGGNREAVEWVLDNAEIDINSISWLLWSSR
jgi:ankyrin repeat protein